MPVSMSGQLTPVTNQYVLNPISINPAYAGFRGDLSIAAFYRKQWVGIAGAPETVTFAADAPIFDGKVGLGLNLMIDKIGVTRENYFITNYSYKIDLDEASLSFGLGAGFITTNTAWSDLVVLDPGDELYLVDSSVLLYLLLALALITPIKIIFLVFQYLNSWVINLTMIRTNTA